MLEFVALVSQLIAIGNAYVTVVRYQLYLNRVYDKVGSRVVVVVKVICNMETAILQSIQLGST